MIFQGAIFPFGRLRRVHLVTQVKGNDLQLACDEEDDVDKDVMELVEDVRPLFEDQGSDPFCQNCIRTQAAEDRFKEFGGWPPEV